MIKHQVIQVQYIQDISTQQIVNKMNKIRLVAHHFILAIALIWFDTSSLVNCNPLMFNPTPWASGPMFAMPMMMGPQFDPYSSMAIPQFMMAPNSPYGSSPFETDRRSNPVSQRSNANGNKGKHSNSNSQNDDQKALDDLPVSFVSTKY